MNAHRIRNRSLSQISLARPNRIVRPELLEKRQLLSCSTPTVQSVRGRDATFDQCFNLEFEHNGEDYEVSAYYTETTTPADLLQCTDTENAAGRCEHLLPNNDDGNGDNIHAVSMAGQARDAFKFFLDRGLKFLPAGETELEVYIAEDPRGGGVPTANSLLTDDELVADPDLLWEELLAYHELHHLVQGQYDGSWDDFYGEGIARSSEDRVRTDLDADTGHLFIPQITNSIDSNTVRTTDLYAQDYDTAAWWTWLWDQYRAGAGENPPVTGANDLGWGAMREFYEELETQQSDELGALADFIAAQGSSFRQDFIDYTLALWAQSFNPTEPRLGYLDNEINNIGPMTGHTIINSAPAFGNTTLNLTPRTSRHIEFNPASQCDFTAFSFDGNGKNYGFSVMTADGGNLQDRWTSYSNNWARTVRTADLDRVVGVVTSFDQSGSVDVGRGCVSPNVQIKSPTTSSFAMVGTADNPRSFIVRLSVTGNGAAIAGLVADEFDVALKKSGSADAPIPVEVINASYVLDDYWLLVQAPDDVAGAETGSFYDLSVTLGGDSDSENFSVVYLERVQDVMLVLDRSGSMDTGGKIAAARNAANLLVMALADEDQGGYVAFDTDAEIQVSLDELSDGNQRQDLEDAIAAEVPLDFTSIGDGLRAALDDYNSNGNPDNLCSIVLMSDGHENEPEYWADVKDDLIAAGCPVHTISFGPGANEVLMQEISGAVSGGSHDYATSEGGVPINSVLGWENNVSRIYENKATQMAGRQRIFTVLGDSAIGGVATGIIDFEDHPTGTILTVGDTFNASGVPGKAEPFLLPGGGQVNTGFARIDNQQMAGGAGHDVQLNNINVGFNFAETLESATALFGYFGGALNISINGKTEVFRTLSLLPQGHVINGVTVNFQMFDNQHGMLTFKGPIDSLGLGGQEFGFDSLRFNSEVGNFHEIPVDKGADILVVSAAWQEKMGGVHTELFDPNGDPVPAARRSLSSQGTNEVWRVPDPIPGNYRMRLMNIPQEYFLTASVRSEFELYTFVGQPQEDMLTGVEVPLVASFISNTGPVLDANVMATVLDPGGTSKVVKLWDDGNHGDGEADDGVYANNYTATSFGDLVQLNPDLVVEGDEPMGVGSYQVTFKAKKDEIVREGLGSFVLNRDKDSDSDGLPDRWEEEHGLDPKNRADGNTDFDKDGLPASCEYRVGTDPRNSDTDDGGRSDGAEVQFVPGQLCRAVRDPLDPADDRIRKVTGIVALPEATPNGGPHVRLKISIPDNDYLFSSIHRRLLNEDGRPIGDWIELEKQFRGPEFEDLRLDEGNYEYQIIPFYFGGEGEPPVEGQHVLSSPVVAKKDPYAPFGSVMIDDADGKTYSPLVTLRIIADDSGHVHDFDPVHQPAPGSPLEKLKMKISNRPDFAGADWQPFQPVVKDWFLGRFQPLQETMRWVYVAFMDEAGNVSEGPIADSIQVLLQPGDTYPFDGKVDIFDLNNVRNNFARRGPVAILIGDAIGALNGVVDISDLNEVRNNFGSFVDAPAATSRRQRTREEIAESTIAGAFASDRPLFERTIASQPNAAARDALFGRFTEVGVDIDSLLTAHRQLQKRGLRALR